MGKDRKSDRGNSHWNIFLIVKKSLYFLAPLPFINFITFFGELFVGIIFNPNHSKI